MADRKTVRIGPGCQAVQLPTGWWHLRWYDPAKSPPQKQHALDADDDAVALARARKLWERKLAGLFDPWKGSGRALSVAEACEAYRRAQADVMKPGPIRLNVSAVLALARSTHPRWTGEEGTPEADPDALALRDVRPEHVRRYVYRPALSRASHLSYWRRYRAFFAWAAERGHVDVNPALAVPRPPPADAGLKHLAPAEIERLLEAVDAYHGPEGPIPEHVRRRDAHPLWAREAFALLAATGMRRGEAVALRWRDVVFPEASPWGVGFVLVEDEGRVTGRRTKTGRSRRVTMIPRAERLLRRLLDETRRTSDAAEPVLKGADGRSAVSPHTLSHNFKRYREHAKLPAVPLHGLRHSFCMELILRGVPLPAVKEEMGHADIKTTMKYLQLLPADRARMMSAAYLDEAARPV